MKPIDLTILQPPTSPRPPETPPSSPSMAPCEQVLTLKHVQHFLDLLKVFQVTQSLQSLRENSVSSDAIETSGGQQHVASRGSKLEFKLINEVWDSKTYGYRIVEPDGPTDAVADLDQYVFVVRQRIDKKTLDPTYFVDINSEGLRDVLRSVLGDVRGVDLNGEKPAVERNLLYHHLDGLQQYRGDYGPRSTYENTCLQHLDLLIDFIEATYKSTTQHFHSLIKKGEITYELLWALFRPNSLVYSTCLGTGKPRCVVYESGEENETTNGLKYYKLECRYLDYDGQVFGEAPVHFAITKFRGTKPISTLTAFPLQHHPDHKGIRALLIHCGRKFVSLLGAHHRHCLGKAFYMKDGEAVVVSVDSRVMLDAAFFRKMKPNYVRPQPKELMKKNDKDGWNDIFSESPGKGSLDRIKSGGAEPTDLEENDLIICCPTVPGFGLSDKLWMEFAVADIESIQWSPVPFTCLTIPEEHKEVIIALAQTRLGMLPGVPFDDFVSGKGRGLNVLLYGTPGVGKTLTAEAVSEHLQRPLYSISAGELSLDSSLMEIQLSRIFQTANHWNALILLDEADVYLEQRTTKDVTRNKLVSVFLRKLEYCEGIMFLTTNRVHDFDEAILSRIHLMLKYPELDLGVKCQIWAHLLCKAHTPKGGAVVAHAEMQRLASTAFNGRQIKNVVTIAHALATKKNTRVTYPHLLQAVKASENFIREFNGTSIIENLYS